MPNCPLNFNENKLFGKIRLKIRFKQISNESLNSYVHDVDGWPSGSALGLRTGRSRVQAVVPPLGEMGCHKVVFHVDLDEVAVHGLGLICGMPCGFGLRWQSM